MKRKIRLTESELTTLIKRMVEQAQDDMDMSYDDMDMDMSYDEEEEQEELSKPEVKMFFEDEVIPSLIN